MASPPFHAVKLLSVGAHSAPKGQNYPPHRHGCWELVFYREGHINAPVGDELFQTRPGMMLLTPPGVQHSEEACTAYSNYFMSVHAAPDQPWPRCAYDDANGTLAYICRSLLAEVKSTLSPDRPFTTITESGTDMQQLLMAQLDLVLRRLHHEQPISNGERLVREAEQIFEECFAQPLVIGEVASAMRVAPSVLRAHFGTCRGYSPATALFRVRVNQALALLSNSDLSLKQIAAACGFHSPSHLSRHVRSVTGEAPGRWRRHVETTPEVING